MKDSKRIHSLERRRSQTVTTARGRGQSRPAARTRRRRPQLIDAPSLFVLSWVFFFGALTPAMAVDFSVANVAQFNAAVPLAHAGDTITLASGTWSNADLVFRGSGTASSPITLRALPSGSVFLTGSSRLHIAGSHLIAQGLIFTNGYPHSLDVIEFQATSYGLATNCEVTDCAIIDFNTPSTSTDTKWVSLYGFSNRVDHCYFKGKRNQGTLMIVWLPPATSLDASNANYHLIDYNYFGPRPLNGGNGGEIIRVGDSDTSSTTISTLATARSRSSPANRARTFIATTRLWNVRAR